MVFPDNCLDEFKAHLKSNYGIDYEPPVDTSEKWSEFSIEMLSNLEFNMALQTAGTTFPTILPAITSALVLESLGKESPFKYLYDKLCQTANVDQATRQLWAGIAERYNLPQTFIQNL
jgi:hypothetical protein